MHAHHAERIVCTSRGGRRSTPTRSNPASQIDDRMTNGLVVHAEQIGDLLQGKALAVEGERTGASATVEAG